MKIFRYVTLPDYLFMGLVLLSITAGAGLIYLNHIDFHYHIVMLFAADVTTLSWLQLLLSFFMSFVFLFYGYSIRRESPRSSTFLCGLGLFYWCLLANMILVNSVQSTPFSPIDMWLLKADRMMGFNTSIMMAWTHNHPHIHKLFNIAYAGLVFELLGIPILLTIFNGRRSLEIFYIAQLSSMIVGSLIYYFWPTVAPSGIVHSPYFLHMQDDTSQRFYQIHHYLKPTSQDGGLIAFPSFHVIWAILLTNACRAKKIFFYPMVCFNIVVILSTVFLGWHYVTDVIGGFVVAIGAIWFAEWVYEDGSNDRSARV